MSEHDAAFKERLEASLNLPRTDFPLRPNAKVDDPAMIERWEKEGLYEKTYTSNKGQTTYVLHDGPPYANGHIHLGHAYNKILKDSITKAYRMSGYHVPVLPGWDCHGLPIELKVVQEKPGLSPEEIKQSCRTYAQKWIDIQREEFKRLGVIMRWDKPYVTMDYQYEATIMRAFGKLLAQGFIERKNKTVAWCPTDQTTLAAAEIEYQDRKDPSIYVRFPLAIETAQRLFKAHAQEPISLLVWTTTPWTLPLNRAVALKPATTYELVRIGDQLLVIGASRAAAIAGFMQQPYEVLQTISSDQFAQAQVQHPFIANFTVPIIFDEGVSLEEGTACVHTAPGCGPSDYELGVKHGLGIYSPISSDGKYTANIVPAELAGMSVADGQIWVIKKLAEVGTLVYKTSLRHSYPHCWRCHNGLIFRATPQWFFDLQKEGIKDRALAAVDQIDFIPSQGKSFLRATVGSRWEWCLSRQRSWGVPIPALLCVGCDRDYITPELVERVACGVEKEGIEYWDRVTVQDLTKDLTCTRCGGAKFRKEYDILDVWFESGVSHFAILYKNPALAFPADLYLEGIDQYRAWFQSSLITSLVLEGEPAMKTIMSHGFTVDGQGRKMSKSLGNVVAPQEIIDQLGTDGLRLWVASIGHEGDAVVSETLLRNVAEVYRKIRNTCRFLLQNLYDFKPTLHMVPASELSYLDRTMLTQLYRFQREMQKEYRKGNVTAVFHGFADFCAKNLSSLYLDVIKDRLYVEAATGHKRRSAQTVVWYLLDTLTHLIAPICSFTAEQLSDHYQNDKTVSIHLQPFVDLSSMWAALERDGQDVLSELMGEVIVGHPMRSPQVLWEQVQEERWQMVLELRDAVLKAIETQREQGVIKHPLEAAVKIVITHEYAKYTQLKNFFEYLIHRKESPETFFMELLIVSQVQLLEKETAPQGSLKGIGIEVSHASGTKCPRCWHWEETIHPHGLCVRCAPLVS